jgi:hypothetical protein
MLAHGSDGAATAFVKKHADGKVPRPRNSFLIYRQEHHPVTVRQNPGMHNNEICKFQRHSHQSVSANDYFSQGHRQALEPRA